MPKHGQQVKQGPTTLKNLIEPFVQDQGPWRTPRNCDTSPH